MDLIYHISCVLLVSMVQSQETPCHLAGHDDFIFVERSVGKMCDPKRPGQLKILPKGNKLSADQCTHIVDGKKYTVLRKKAIGRAYIQWRFCGSGNKFDRQICQYDNKCYVEESITPKMKKLVHDVVSIPMKDSRQKKDYPQIKLEINPSNLGRSIPIDKCRHGIYNNVFYANNEPKYCVINDLSKDKNKCLSMRLLNDAMKHDLSAENFEYNDNGDFTVEYKRYIFKHRYTIYDEGDTYPRCEMLRDTLYKPFNRNYMAFTGETNILYLCVKRVFKSICDGSCKM
uniref:Uncharacterized protein n=1 Tax=Romanomermis culicivorax TaxID=13658 RepID=A0A915L9Q8_ROMCU